MKYSILFLVVISPSIMAGPASNSQMLDLYNSQLQETKRLFKETQDTMIEAAPVREMSQKIGRTTPDVIKISKRFLSLAEQSKNIYGSDLILHPTPFADCARLPSTAYSLWLEQISQSENNSTAIQSLGESYIQTGKGCVDAMKNPPSIIVEESDSLEIIDVSQ